MRESRQHITSASLGRESRGSRRLRSASRDRGDEGNLILVLVLVLALSMLAALTVASLIPSFTVARTSQTGEQAVAQANAGLHDALFHLDQLGDNPSSFCAGNPPAALMSAASLSSCFITGSTPLSNAPGLKYYLADVVTNSLPPGITDQLKITSYADVDGQVRTVVATVYRVADSYGLFGVSGVNAEGALKQSQVYEVGGFPVTSFADGTVYVGVGSNGSATCNGNSSGTSIQTIGQQGSQNSGCPAWTQTQLNLEPADPTTCSSGQVSTAFTPCIDTSSFATYGGVKYCPLWGTGVPNTLSSTTDIASSSSAPSSSAVFDCAAGDYGGTAGSTVHVGTSSTGCPIPPSSSSPVPFGFTSVPAGSYYFDSNNLTIDNIDECLMSGAVSFYDLPAACGSSSCAEYVPTSSSSGGGKCTSVPTNSAVNLTLNGSDINAGTPKQTPFDFTPGNPANFSLYWSGNNSIGLSKNLVYDGLLYAPGAVWTTNGSGYETFGSLVTNCMAINGSPNLYFVYPEHPKGYLTNWTVSNYSITP